MAQSYISLTLEALEARTVPAVLSTQTFDAVTPPALPTGWAAWASDGTTAFSTAAKQGVGGSVALVSSGGSRTSAMAWEQQTVSGDTGAAVSVQVNSLVPVYVFARGTDPGTNQESYLAAVITRGLQVELVQVTGTQTTVLATVTSPKSAYYSGGWVQVSIQPTGSSVAVQVTRQDTGQHLTSAGTWQTAATSAITATTSLASTTGYVGVGRDALYSGAVSLDNFETLGTAPVSPPVSPPPASGTVTQSFDTTAAGTAPAGWSGWSSYSGGTFAVSTTEALSTPNGFTSNGLSTTVARAWDSTAMPADVSASASVFLNSLIPAEVFVRGSNLTGTTPTYYAVVVTRGTTATLVKVVDGVQTTLGTLTTKAYLSYAWVQVRLIAQGDRLEVELYRADTQQWLAPNGTWSGEPNYALTVQDSSITAGGYVGVGRLAGAAGPVSVDNFAAAPAGTVGPQVSVTGGSTGTVSGKVTYTATATGSPNHIEFLLNNVVQTTAVTSPATWTFDSTTVADGPYTLVVLASDSAGDIGSTTLTLTVSNTMVPTIPQLTSTGIAELAYNGTPVTGATEQSLLKSAVDLVVSSTSYLSTIAATAPNTPQVIYNNVSNLYGSLLASWLTYAYDNNVNPELAFYHVTQATPYTGASPSSQPVNWFWGAYQSNSTGDLTDETSVSHGGSSSVIAAGGTGTYTAVGYIEPYNIINLTLAQLPGAGWSGQWQYVSAVSASGAPTQWSTLTLYSDGTGGLTTSGQILFNPPSNWVPAILTPGGYQLYYVRYVAVSGTAAAAPKFLNILGDDYVNSGGQNSGTIPAFDYALAGGKDYLTPAEYAQRAPGDDAWFVYQTRLFYPYYGPMRFITDPSSVPVQDWAAVYNEQLLAANPLAEGVFLDNSSGDNPVAGMSLMESTTNYSRDSGALVGAIARAIAPKWVVVNTSGGTAATSAPLVDNAAVSFEESLLRPETVNWAGVLDAADLVSSQLDQPNDPYVVLDSSAVGGSPTDPTTELATLAYYDLLAVPGRTLLDFFGGDSPSTTWAQHWSAAAAVNIGTPTGAMQVATTGADPENAALTYKVYSRQFSNGLVLYKPLSYTEHVGTGATDASTATTVQLNGSYRVVNADGTLGSVVTSVSLRNGAGVVLVKA